MRECYGLLDDAFVCVALDSIGPCFWRLKMDSEYVGASGVWGVDDDDCGGWGDGWVVGDSGCGRSASLFRIVAFSVLMPQLLTD